MIPVADVVVHDTWDAPGLRATGSCDYSVDGAVLHSDRSCKPYSIGQVDLKERLAADLGVRVLLLEADHNDPRAWAPEQGENRITAFMESFVETGA